MVLYSVEIIYFFIYDILHMISFKSIFPRAAVVYDPMSWIKSSIDSDK